MADAGEALRAIYLRANDPFHTRRRVVFAAVACVAVSLLGAASGRDDRFLLYAPALALVAFGGCSAWARARAAAAEPESLVRSIRSVEKQLAWTLPLFLVFLAAFPGLYAMVLAKRRETYWVLHNAAEFLGETLDPPYEVVRRQDLVLLALWGGVLAIFVGFRGVLRGIRRDLPGLAAAPESV